MADDKGKDRVDGTAPCSTWYLVEDSEVPLDSKTPVKAPMDPASPADPEITNLLSRNYGNVTGGELHSQPIIAVPASSWKAILSEGAVPLKKVFAFLVWSASCHHQTPLAEVKYVIVSDVREADWGQLKQLLAVFKAILPLGIQRVVLLTRTNRLSLAKFGIKPALDDLPFKVDMVQSIQALHSVLPSSELTRELGGNLLYNNDDWMFLFIKGETLCGKCTSTCANLSSTQERCQEFQVGAVSSVTKSEIERLHSEVEQTLDGARVLLDQAMEFVSNMLTEHRRFAVSSMTNHYAGIASRVQASLTNLSITSDQLSDAWKWQRDRVDNLRRTQAFRELVDQVSVDMEKELGRLCTDLGSSLETASSLLADHRALVEMLMTGVVASGNVLAAESGAVVSRPHCHRPDEVQESAAALSKHQQELIKELEHRKSLLEMSVELHSVMERGMERCEEGLHLLATQSMESCLSEGGSSDALLNLSRFLDRLDEVDVHKMDLILEALPLSHQLSERVSKLKKKLGDIQGLVTARIEGIQTLATKHSELVHRGQLSARAEQRSLSGASNGSITPPPLQDTAACRTPTSDTVASGWKASPRHERSKSSGALLTQKYSTSPGPQTPRPYPLARSSTVAGTPNNKIGSPDLQLLQSSLQHSPALTRSYPMDSSMGEDSGVFSGFIEDSETNTRVLEKRGYIMSELLETERTYIHDLQETLDYYWEPLRPDNEAVPASWRARRNVLFGNLPRLLEFHKSTFLEELESCADSPERVGLCFLHKQRQFQLYVSYCKNKYKSDAFLAELDMQFFEDIRKKRGHRLSLKTFLIKPVQRITKYQLLLKELMAQCTGAPMAQVALQKALGNMLDILQHVNNVMHSMCIIGFPGSFLEQGHLLLQDSFIAWKESGSRLKLLRNHTERERHVFLYEQVLILSKKRLQTDGGRQTQYTYKDSIKIPELALTETVDGGSNRFQVAHHKHGKVYTLQARSSKVKDAWVAELRNLLEQQLTNMQNTAKQEEGLMTLPRPAGHRVSELSTPPSTSNLARSASNCSHWSQSTLTKRRIVLDSTAAMAGISKTESNTDSFEGVDSGLDMTDRNAADADADDVDDDALDEDDDVKIAMSSPLSEPSFVVASPANRQFYAVTADFRGDEEGEISYVVVGDAVEVLQLGHGGWWEVRKLKTNELGWIPATYLSEISSRSLLPVLETSI